jgi:hypothetical protein
MADQPFWTRNSARSAAALGRGVAGLTSHDSLLRLSEYGRSHSPDCGGPDATSEPPDRSPGGSLLLLACLGALAAWTGGARMAPGAIRVTFRGALAMNVTAGGRRIVWRGCLRSNRRQRALCPLPGTEIKWIGKDQQLDYCYKHRRLQPDRHGQMGDGPSEVRIGAFPSAMSSIGQALS